jgi:NAD-dependent deacetylase
MHEPSLPKLIVFSGAGLSAESGLATFRGQSGLWEDVPLEIVCNYATWKQNFEAVHAFYDARRGAVSAAKPNEAHRTIAGWQKRWPGRVRVITQNIDRLLEEAGCHGVVHLHGDARLMHCVECDLEWEIEEAIYDQSGCPVCHRKKSVKPGVVFFGQAAPHYDVLHEIAASLRPEDTALVVGTSGAVLPADRIFGHSPAYSILVNLEPGREMDEAAFSERHYGAATRLLPELTEKIERRMALAGQGADSR